MPLRCCGHWTVPQYGRLPPGYWQAAAGQRLAPRWSWDAEILKPALPVTVIMITGKHIGNKPLTRKASVKTTGSDAQFAPTDPEFIISFSPAGQVPFLRSHGSFPEMLRRSYRWDLPVPNPPDEHTAGRDNGHCIP